MNQIIDYYQNKIISSRVEYMLYPPSLKRFFIALEISTYMMLGNIHIYSLIKEITELFIEKGGEKK